MGIIVGLKFTYRQRTIKGKDDGCFWSDTETADADDLDRDPKKRWFCTPDHFDGKTKVYATKFAKGDDSRHYPMAWSDPEIDVGVPGEDRTAYYMSVCGAPPPAAAPKPN